MNILNTVLLFLLMVVVTISFPLKAHAYIDPGTGSMLLQAVLAAVVGIAMAVKLFWRKIKFFFMKLLGKPIPQESSDPPLLKNK